MSFSDRSEKTRSCHASGQGFAKAKEMARAAGRIAVEEAMTWDVFRWIVVTLLLLILIFMFLVYSGTEHVTALSQHDPNTREVDSASAEIEKPLKEARVQISATPSPDRSGLRQLLAQGDLVPAIGSIEPSSVPLPTRAPKGR
jgi:hypothetical protein